VSVLDQLNGLKQIKVIKSSSNVLQA
jgi:hypothetical protein